MKKSYPCSIKTIGLVLILLLSFSFGALAQNLIHVELWQNAAGTGMVNNYPVWIKLGAPLNYTTSGTTDNSGRFTDSLPNITVNTPATFITYDCTGARIVSQITLSPSQTWYGDTLVVGCSSLVPAIDAHLRNFRTGPASFNFWGDKKDTALPTTGIVYNYNWFFGDGQSSSGTLQGLNFTNTSHSYISSGIYNACFSITAIDSVLGVTLFTADSCVNVTASVTNSCQADFIASTTGSGAYFFQDSSSVSSVPTGGSVSYAWDFGDGNGDTTQSASHTYQNTGIYNACHWVVVRNAQANIVCSDTICKQVTYGMSSLNCFADFMYSGSSSGAFTFMDSSSVSSVPTGGSVSYGWDFGNGFGANTQSATHTYSSPGTYNVCHWIVVRNTQSTVICTDTICKSVVYSGSPNPMACVVNFMAAFNPGTLTMNFIDSSSISTGQNVSYQWLFGDGNGSTQQNPIHTYTVHGNYNACLLITVRDSSNTVICTDSICKNVQVGIGTCNMSLTVRQDSFVPLKYSAINVVSPSLNLVFDTSYSIYDFGDGTIKTWQTATANLISHTYANPGLYQICVYNFYMYGGDTICSSSSCSSITATGGPFCQAEYIVDTINSYQGNVFIWNTSTPSNTSAIHANSYQWDFGDGNTSNQPFPVHTYPNPGMYGVCLTITSVDSANNFCTDTYCDTLGVDSLGNLIYKNSAGFTLNVLDPNAIGLEEKLVQEFSVYPNPAEDMVTLAWDELVSGELNWQITDLKGAILMRGTQDQTNKKEMQLDVSRLKAGVYILSASHKNSPAAHHKLKIN